MVVDPDPMIGRWVDAGCDIVTVHAEACTHLHRTLGAIGELGVRAGVALNPATPPAHVEHVLDVVDLVLVMTVNPGCGGQRYLASMESKIAQVSELVARSGRDIEIAVDGGISAETIRSAWEAGARTFVSGSAREEGTHGGARAVP